MDLITETAGVLRELGRMKSKDGAKPRVENHPISGTYLIPTVLDWQAIKVTITSSRPDWPFFSTKCYDLEAGEYINPPNIYKQSQTGLSTVTVFWIPIGREVGGVLRLEWTVIAQSPIDVEMEIV